MQFLLNFNHLTQQETQTRSHKTSGWRQRMYSYWNFTLFCKILHPWTSHSSV